MIHKKSIIPAVAVLIGTTIGVGFLGIPYVVSKSGFIPGFFLLLAIALFMLVMKLYLGEIILRTNGNHQLTGYAEKYLGKKGKFLMFFSMLFGIYSALLAYLIGEGESLSYLFGINTPLFFSLLFWCLMLFLTYIGLRALKKYEKIAIFIVLAIILMIFVFYFKDIKAENLSYINKNNLFAPFGVILFSFLAFSAMPEVKRLLYGNERKMKKVVFLGVFIPLIAYSLFTLISVGVFGSSIKEIATLSFGRFFSLLGIITMFTAYFTLCIAIRDMFRFDFKLGRTRGWLVANILPLILFLLVYFFKLASFTKILAVSGVVSAGLTGILILFMNKNAKLIGKRKPEYALHIDWKIIAVLSILFILAVVMEFLP